MPWSSSSQASARPAKCPCPVSKSCKRLPAVEMMSHWAFCSSRHRTMSAMFFCTLCSSAPISPFCSSLSPTAFSSTCAKSASSFSSRALCPASGARPSACWRCSSRSSASCPDQVRRCAISRSVALKASVCPWTCSSTPWSPASSSATRSLRPARLWKSSSSFCPLALMISLRAALVLSLRAFACWQVLCISACFSFSSLQTLPCLSSLLSTVPLILSSTSGRPLSKAPMRPSLSASDFWRASMDDAICVSISLVLPTEALVIS
mmetsp:Transcript_36796/g.106074  ORF Transcript_36796/g.106074 Transcript_36796/m.106074 type:complete len:264 (+) Transcript_36796:444-1235(+)